MLLRVGLALAQALAGWWNGPHLLFEPRQGLLIEDRLIGQGTGILLPELGELGVQLIDLLIDPIPFLGEVVGMRNHYL
ncbi:hypothetical protein SAMN07250955_105161 [Arboricoccus pini]|uniref:Uncharacterized protein n=1 Tax=Arboricoccus pini TaxID=1963835 RepID=A0A212R3T7_9PROT|nr:hypothetical protein [Arboricoccus pini]SNB66666.1 hypothetical protein SAMN07250955_105161 [Arboricoccus pini]